MKRSVLSAIILVPVLSIAAGAAPQLNWSAYDTSGNLLNANAGIGGEVASSVSLTVPANSTMVFVTRNFTPLDLSVNGTLSTVNFNLSAQGLAFGLNNRALGIGLYNTAGTAGNVTDDAGYFGLWHGTGQNSIELFTHNTGNNLFAGAQQGVGATKTGVLADNVTYNSLIRIRSDATGKVGLGNGGATLAKAGLAFTDGSATTQTAYMNTVAAVGGYKTFDQFAIYLSNTSTEDEVVVSLSEITLTPILVPEPSSFALAGLGLLGLLVRRNRN
jgi:hypothetical protein